MKPNSLILPMFILQFMTLACLANIEIKVSGVDDSIKTNILLFTDTENLNCTDTEESLNSFISNLPKTIEKATQPFGYYQTSVDIQSIRNKKGCLSLNAKVDLGRPIVIRKLDLTIQGDYKSDSKVNEIVKNSKLIVGKRLIQSDYENLKNAFLNYAFEMGYLDAQFIQNTIDIYPNDYAADITLQFKGGDRFKIEKVEILQQPEFLNEKFIKNMIFLKPNQYFSRSDLIKLRRNLVSTGYFKQVTIDVESEKRLNNNVSIKITLTPADRIKYSTGVGYSTDTGPRITLSYDNQRISDYGYQFNSKLSLSGIISELSSGIKIPSKSKALNEWSNIDVGYREERSDEVTSNTLKLGISQTRIKKNKWQNINYIDVINEKFKSDDTFNTSTLLIPGTNWSLVKADDLVHTRKGYKFQIDLKATHQSLLSDASFVQLDASYKKIMSFKQRHRILTRFELGTTYTNDFSEIPSSYRFFAGGDNSIRGFSYQEIGPVDSNGDVDGGKHLVLASFEYEYRFAGSWAGTVFTDVGDAFNEDFKLSKSIGTGLRWFSPIGPIRFDIGFPINNQRDFKIHITLGPDL